jgi:hypothetical protein
MTDVALNTISCNCPHKVEDKGTTGIGTDGVTMCTDMLFVNKNAFYHLDLYITGFLGKVSNIWKG